MPTISKGRTMGDVVRYVLHPGYCIVSAYVVNPNAAAYAAQNLVGQPVKASGANYVFVESTDEAAVIGLFMHDKPVALGVSETTTIKYPILVRGPALVDQDSLPVNDVAGVAFDTVAQLVTALAALDPPIIAVRQPVTESEQTD